MRALSCLVVLALAAASLLAAGKVSDDQIYDHVRLRLATDAQVKGGNLTVQVKEGVVTLEGKVRTEKQKKRAERITKKVKGVVKVINSLVVEPVG